jgi:hypothetical protein
MATPAVDPALLAATSAQLEAFLRPRCAGAFKVVESKGWDIDNPLGVGVCVDPADFLLVCALKDEFIATHAPGCAIYITEKPQESERDSTDDPALIAATSASLATFIRQRWAGHFKVGESNGWGINNPLGVGVFIDAEDFHAVHAIKQEFIAAHAPGCAIYVVGKPRRGMYAADEVAERTISKTVDHLRIYMQEHWCDKGYYEVTRIASQSDTEPAGVVVFVPAPLFLQCSDMLDAYETTFATGCHFYIYEDCEAMTGEAGGWPCVVS